MQKLKTIAITMGDPGGIGPEIIVKALASDKIKKNNHSNKIKTRFLVVGNENILKHTAEILKIKFRPQKISNPNKLNELDEGVYLFEINPALFAKRAGYSEKGRDKQKVINGRAALEYIFAGIKLAQEDLVDALVTAPVSKQAINDTGHSFKGHTELLAKQTNTRKVVMMFITKRLKVSLVTTHLSYKKVLLYLNVENILNTIAITAKSLQKYFGFASPRLGVCGLNPHAGEGGWLGNEEKMIVAPAVEQAQKQGIVCSGPFPADTIFQRALAGEFDAVVAMYHDQGLIPLKTIANNEGVNVTLGLPIIRTSVMHGTGFDIAGKGIADPNSMITAISLAFEMSLKQTDLFGQE